MTIDLASIQSRDGARRVFAGPGGLSPGMWILVSVRQEEPLTHQ